MGDNLMFHRHLAVKQRCDLCQKATADVYQVNQDGYLLTFDTPDHARTGVANWEVKKAKGIKPNVPYKEEESDVLEDNI